VRGRGLPKGKSGERGDFFVTINIVLPTHVSDEERQLWEQLRRVSTFKPNA
jgi:curved DNA-binding protein